MTLMLTDDEANLLEAALASASTAEDTSDEVRRFAGRLREEIGRGFNSAADRSHDLRSYVRPGATDGS